MLGKKNVKMIMKFQELDLRYKYFEKILQGVPPSPQARLLGFSQGRASIRVPPKTKCKTRDLTFNLKGSDD